MRLGGTTNETSDDSSLTLDRWTILIIVAALLCEWIYSGYTSYTVRNADGWEHLRYVTYLVDHHSLPSALNCNVCHHPPLYYAIAAGVAIVGEHFHVQDVPLLLQRLSLVFSAWYLLFAAMTLRLYVSERLTQWVGTALIAFFPGNIIASCRLHNDSLANALVVAAAYFVLAWWQGGNGRKLANGSLLIGLAILTKSTGAVVLGLLVALSGHRIWKAKSQTLVIRELLPAAAILTTAIGLRSWLRVPIKGASLCFSNLGRACQPADRNLDRGLSTYFGLNFREYLAEPFLRVGPGSVEEGNFWNCLLKSSLFGMYQGIPDPEMSNGINTQLALGLNVLLLLLVLSGLVLAATANVEWFLRHMPLLVLCSLSIAFLIAFRLAVSNPHHGDIRHVLGVTVWVSVLLMSLLERQLRSRRWIYFSGLGLSLVLVCVSIVFFMPKPA